MSNNVSGMSQILSGFMSMVSDSNGKISPGKLLTLVFLISFLTALSNLDKVSGFIKEINSTKTHEAYIVAQEKLKKVQFDAAVKNHSQILYSMLHPDMVGVWIYKPEHLHHFKDLIHFEGTLPDGSTSDSFQNIGVDRTSDEYLEHIRGLPYQSDGPVYSVATISHKKYYIYSCPIFDSRGSYHGVLGMYWGEKPKDIDEKKFFSQCSQAARFIGSNI